MAGYNQYYTDSPIQSPMTDGVKILFWSIIQGMWYILAYMPVWNKINAFYTSWLAANPNAICTDAVGVIQTGVLLIPPIAMLLVAMALFRMYYGATHQREYQQKLEVWNDYNR